MRLYGSDMNKRWLALLLLGLLAAIPAHAVERNVYKSSGVVFSVSVRTPEQIRAFYLARGFPQAAVHELEAKCLVTIGVQNGRDDVLWLEPAKWRFTTDKGEKVARISRPEWNARWTQLNIPLASRATFGWTQLPESRDLLPGEWVGGNVAVVAPSEAFSVEAIFDTGANRRGPKIKIKADKLKCGPLSEGKK